MRKYALIGDPVSHSLSPRMHDAAFRALGLDATYDAIRVTSDTVAEALARLRDDYAGFNVTTPLKELVWRALDDATPEATAAGAANTVRLRNGRMEGHNTDGLGLVAALAEAWQLTPRDKAICMLGSGPAARAIANALRASGAASIACWSRNRETAALIGEPPNATPDVLVCALPADAEIPAQTLEAVAGAHDVVDVNYAARRSPIPAGVGRRRMDGLPLLLHQGALAFEWWTQKKAPLEAMRAALRR